MRRLSGQERRMSACWRRGVGTAKVGSTNQSKTASLRELFVSEFANHITKLASCDPIKFFS